MTTCMVLAHPSIGWCDLYAPDLQLLLNVLLTQRYNTVQPKRIDKNVFIYSLYIYFCIYISVYVEREIGNIAHLSRVQWSSL